MDDEIEVTDAMKAAGADAYEAWARFGIEAESLVSFIYRAMEAQRRADPARGEPCAGS